MSKEELPSILTAADIAGYLKISRKRVYELLQLSPSHGGIVCMKFGLSRRVEKSDFLAWMQKQKS